jgi:hypothetical protein
MRRTTVYLDADLEVRLKLEAMRRKQPMAELLREAIRCYLMNVPRKLPPGAGAFDSGHADTASRHEEVLGQGLVAAYREMAADERRETEAREWAEAHLSDAGR